MQKRAHSLGARWDVSGPEASHMFPRLVDSKMMRHRAQPANFSNDVCNVLHRQVDKHAFNPRKAAQIETGLYALRGRGASGLADENRSKSWVDGLIQLNFLAQQRASSTTNYYRFYA